MAPRLLLYFGATGHALYSLEGTGLRWQQHFTPDDAGLNRCRDYFKDRAGALLQVVADLDGEDFHEDQIPFLRGAERRAVIERRLAQRYRETRLASALSLGYAADERRSERLLLASFHDAQPLVAWLEALERAGATVASVYSTALLAPALGARLGVKDERFVVMTANRAGLRQTFVERGRLRFSRLEHFREGAARLTAALVRTETERMLKYLATLRAAGEQALPVFLIVPESERGHFARSLGSGAGLAFTTIGLAEAARRVGVRRLPEGAAAEALYLHLAARRAPKDQFLRGENRRGLLAWKLQRFILSAGVAGFVSCGAYAAMLWLEQLTVHERIEGTRIDTARTVEQFARVSARFPATPAPIETLKGTAAEFRRIAARSALPEAALEHVSRALDQSPRIELDSLAWSAEPEQTLEIKGRLSGASSSEHRAIAEEVRRFSSFLAAGSGWRVTATRLPFELSSEGVLSVTAGADSVDAPRFSVRIARK